MNNESVMKISNLKKYFPIKVGFIKSLASKEIPAVRAVDDISFDIRKEEIFGLVGESGCGKTTTGRLTIRLLEPTEGSVFFEGKDLAVVPNDVMRKLRQKLQIVFQDPYESLNPRMSVFDIISEPLHIQNITASEEQTRDRVHKVMEEMGLVPPEEFLYRFPHEISGGQRQRVAIARAFVLGPEFIVADEPVSMLDASIRTQVLKLIKKLVKQFHVSFLYITHDIATSRHMCNRLAVMYLGKIVEMGPTESVIKNPFHHYTDALIAAVPVPDPTARRIEVVIKGEVPSAFNPPPGCRFHTRCPRAQDICKKEEPELIDLEKERYVACHFPLGK
ncbi:MAG: ABC transporter ATP-binding protein [Candidatus Bathyarchaeota archaeon]|nr:MAG: ABC transporter ATP-binding protein [Candidatus Bathyarchaeota archaeon]